MSNETRTMFVVLAVCGFLMCGCIAVPIGVGAMFFLTASRQADMAQVQAQRALAAEQQARAQAELAKAQAQAQAAAPIAVPGMPAIPAPLVETPPTLLPPGLAAPNLADIEQRKALYAALKELRKAEDELEKVNTEDATVGIIAAAVKQQQETLLKGAGITRDEIDQILAEGDKAGW
jgi:multidrug efflux pump subunit AcrA (membrane-fusion protein)